MIDQQKIVRFRKQNWITMVAIIVWEETVVNLAHDTFGLSRYQNRPCILHSQIHLSYLIIFVLHFCSVLSKWLVLQKFSSNKIHSITNQLVSVCQLPFYHQHKEETKTGALCFCCFLFIECNLHYISCTLWAGRNAFFNASHQAKKARKAEKNKIQSPYGFTTSLRQGGWGR